MEKEIYLKFAVYNSSGKDYLVKVMEGYAASDAWMVSDEAFIKVAGRKFFGLFGDDGRCVCCDKGHIRRLISEDEYNSLREAACITFKRMDKALSTMDKVLKNHTFADWRDKVRAQQEIHSFTFYGHGMFDHPLLNIDPDDSENDDKFEDLAKIVMKLK